MNEYALIIGGEKVATGSLLDVKNPYDGSPVGRVHIAGKEEIESAIASAVLGFEILKESTVRMRVAWLDKARALLLERAADFAESIALESGKTIREARGEVSRAAETLRLSAIAAEEHMGSKVLPIDAAPNGDGKWGFCQRFGAGPVLAITPFNFPLNLAMHKIGPAIAAGNSFILKPASPTPITGIKLGQLMLDAGVPKQAVSVLVGPGSAVAEPIASDDRIKVVTFTGSPSVGRHLAKTAGMKLFAFELGSNSAAYVHEDADIMFAANRIAKGAFALAGQVCISTQRVYIHKAIFEGFIELLISATRALKTGNQMDESTDIGPMITESETDRVCLWISDVVSKGAEILIGGNRDGSIIEPTVITNVPQDSDLLRLEAFGPVVVVELVESSGDALARIDDSAFGLHAGIFTENIHLAREAFEKLDVGGVIINDTPTWRADLIPYGGNKLSGLGREGPEFALEHMTVWKTFVVQKPPEQ